MRRWVGGIPVVMFWWWLIDGQITYLDEYYLTNAEIEVLERNAEEMARNIQAESMVIELGSG